MKQNKTQQQQKKPTISHNKRDLARVRNWFVVCVYVCIMYLNETNILCGDRMKCDNHLLQNNKMRTE